VRLGELAARDAIAAEFEDGGNYTLLEGIYQHLSLSIATYIH
jgi:hypothetical protein